MTVPACPSHPARPRRRRRWGCTRQPRAAPALNHNDDDGGESISPMRPRPTCATNEDGEARRRRVLRQRAPSPPHLLAMCALVDASDRGTPPTHPQAACAHNEGTATARGASLTQPEPRSSTTTVTGEPVTRNSLF